MALLAPVMPWRSGELPLVLVGMAVDTLRKPDFEFRFLARRNMTRRALYCPMRKREWKTGLGVVSNGEGRRAPALHGMATLAASAIPAR
jgi:hypothetical protein